MKPITVITSVFNGEDFLRDTIESVLSQTFIDFTFLLLDDGSTDKSASIIQSFNDPRIVYVYQKHNFIRTLNKGLELTQGKYIALLDHDDIMMPYRLKMQYDFMEANPDISACGGYMHSFGQQSRRVEVPLDHDSIVETFLIYSPIANPTGFVRKEILTDHKIKYKNGYFFSADYKFWSDIAKVGKLINIPKILTLYRKHQNQASVKYLDKCFQGGLKVKIEMLNYFLSHLKKGDELTDAIEEKFIPVLNDMGKRGFFSEEFFFLLMKDMIRGLRKNNLLEV